MVWEQNVFYIVMLSNETENGRVSLQGSIHLIRIGKSFSLLARGIRDRNGGLPTH